MVQVSYREMINLLSEKKTEHINIRVSPTVKNMVKKLADESGRNVNEYITEMIVEKYLETAIVQSGGTVMK